MFSIPRKFVNILYSLSSVSLFSHQRSYLDMQDKGRGYETYKIMVYVARTSLGYKNDIQENVHMTDLRQQRTLGFNNTQTVFGKPGFFPEQHPNTLTWRALFYHNLIPTEHHSSHK